MYYYYCLGRDDTWNTDTDEMKTAILHCTFHCAFGVDIDISWGWDFGME